MTTFTLYVGTEEGGLQAIVGPSAADDIGGFDAVFDNSTDDRAEIKAALDHADSSGRVIGFRATSYVASIPTSEFNWNYSAQPALVVNDGNKVIDGRGATLRFAAGSRGICVGTPWTDYMSSSLAATRVGTITADVAVGAITYTMSTSDAAKFTTGDLVRVSLGDITFDANEPEETFFAKVTATTSTTVTVDRPATRAVTVASTSSNKYLVKVAALNGLAIRDLTLTGPTGGSYESGIDLRCMRGGVIDNLHGSNAGAGLIVAQHCEDVRISGCTVDTMRVSQASYGCAFAFAECRNMTLTNCGVRNARGFAKAEGVSTITINGGRFDNTLLNSGSPRTDITVITASARSTFMLNDFLWTGYGGDVLVDEAVQNGSAYDSRVMIRNLRIQKSTTPKSFPVTTLTGLLDYEVAGTRQIYDFDRAFWWRRRITLTDSMNQDNILGPVGVLTDLRVFASTNMTGLTACYVGRVGDNGSDKLSSFVAGQFNRIAVGAGSDYNPQWSLRAAQFKLLVQTTTGTAGYIEVWARMAPPLALSAFGAGTIQTWTNTDWEAML